MSHALSVFATALFVTVWFAVRDARSIVAPALLGAAGGLMVLMRFQDAPLLAAPFLVRLPEVWRSVSRGNPAGKSLRWCRDVAVAAAVMLVVFSPQLLVWNVLYRIAVHPSPHPGPADRPHQLDRTAFRRGARLGRRGSSAGTPCSSSRWARPHRCAAIAIGVVGPGRRSDSSFSGFGQLLVRLAAGRGLRRADVHRVHPLLRGRPRVAHRVDRPTMGSRPRSTWSAPRLLAGTHSVRVRPRRPGDSEPRRQLVQPRCSTYHVSLRAFWAGIRLMLTTFRPHAFLLAMVAVALCSCARTGGQDTAREAVPAGAAPESGWSRRAHAVRRR